MKYIYEIQCFTIPPQTKGVVRLEEEMFVSAPADSIRLMRYPNGGQLERVVLENDDKYWNLNREDDVFPEYTMTVVGLRMFAITKETYEQLSDQLK